MVSIPIEFKKFLKFCINHVPIEIYSVLIFCEIIQSYNQAFQLFQRIELFVFRFELSDRFHEAVIRLADVSNLWEKLSGSHFYKLAAVRRR